MVKKVLISFVGNNDYDKIKYILPKKEYYTEFFAYILFKELKPDLSIFLGTSTSRWDFLCNLKETLEGSKEYENLFSEMTTKNLVTNEPMIL